MEIEAALQRGIRVIPVLVDGATMPRREDLPDSLQKLRRRQAIEISHNRFDSDVERLTHALSLIEEELRQRDAAEAERAAREEPERVAAEAAEKAQRLGSKPTRRGKPRRSVERETPKKPNAPRARSASSERPPRRRKKLRKPGDPWKPRLRANRRRITGPDCFLGPVRSGRCRRRGRLRSEHTHR